jgi:hypothetical protein
MTKLTLSADRDLVEEAKKLAEEEGTSLSALFSRLLRAMTAGRTSQEPVAPLTRKATGLVRLPRAESDELLLEDALARKYGIRR